MPGPNPVAVEAPGHRDERPASIGPADSEVNDRIAEHVDSWLDSAEVRIDLTGT